MGNCCLPIRLRRSSALAPKEVTLLLVGLDSAGKTTIAKRLAEEPLDGVVPTVGFSRISLREKGCHVTIFDLGGGPQIRDIWPRYYADIHGVIFVVDASDVARMGECKKVLEGLLLDSYISGKPVLLLANKQDVDGALDEIDIVDRLNVERLVNQQKCPTLVELCSARHFSRKMDIGIDNGYKWLLRCISKDYPSLNDRVLKDLETQEELERIRRAQRQERIKKRRQEEEARETLIRTESNGSRQHSGEKPHRNGHVSMIDSAGIPGQVQDDSNVSSRIRAPDAGQSAFANSRRSFSFTPEMCKFALDDPDCELLRGLDDKARHKNFLMRPKSSGPRLNRTKSDHSKRNGQRRKTYRRFNKTAPCPMTDATAEPDGPVPNIFHSSHHSKLKIFAERKDVAEAPFPPAVEMQSSSKSVPGSRKGSAHSGRKRCSSGDGGSSDITKHGGGLPPLRVTKAPYKQEIIIDVTKLDS